MRPDLISRSARRALSLSVAAGLAACADDSSTAPGADAAVDAVPADADSCDEPALLPTAYRPIAMVSTGTVAVTTTAGVTSGTIDATAGGLAGAADNPYIYLNLDTGTRVDLGDVDAFGSSAWHLALKRSSLRINSGDSGPSTVAAAPVAATTLAEVTAPPSSLATDDWASTACELLTLPGGEPATAMGDWYHYDATTHQLAPKAEVWVLRLPDGSHKKLRIVTYYGDPASAMRGAYYRVEWAAL